MADAMVVVDGSREDSAMGRSTGPPLLVTNNFIVSLSILVGLLGTVEMSLSLDVKTGEFYYFATYALQVLEQTPFVLYVSLAALVVGFLGVVAGCCLGTSGLLVRRFPRLVYVAALGVFVHAVLALVVGVMVLQGISVIDTAIYKQSSTQALPGSFTSNAVHFQLAMFNQCCASEGWSVEVFDPSQAEGNPSPDALDTGGFVKYCNSLHVDNRANMASKGTRTCFTDQETYRQMNSTVGSNAGRICLALSQATASVKGKKIPGSNFDVTALTDGQPTVTLVGGITGPTFGCGTGYAKAFQAAMLFWVEDYLKPVSVGFLVMGAIELALVFIIFAANYACNVKKETTDEAYNRYMAEIQQDSQQRAGTASQHQSVVGALPAQPPAYGGYGVAEVDIDDKI